MAIFANELGSRPAQEMRTMEKTAIYREDDKELLGFVAKVGEGWQAQTLFGYGIDRAETADAAEAIVRREGLVYLTGVWQYLDNDDDTWHPCVLKEVNQLQVTVIRTNFMGYQDPDDFKIVTIKNPSELNLVKS